MAAFRLLLACCVFLVFPMSLDSLPEPGKQKMEFPSKEKYLGFSKALYKGASIYVKGICNSKDSDLKITISWKLKYTQCADLFVGVKGKTLMNLWETYRKYEISGEDTVLCKNHIQLKDQSSQAEYIPPNDKDTANAAKGDAVSGENSNEGRSPETGDPKGPGGKAEDSNDPGQNGQQNGDNDRQGNTSNVNDGGSNKAGLQANPAAKSKNANATNRQGRKKKDQRKERSAEMKDKGFKSLLRVKRDRDIAESEEKRNEGKKNQSVSSNRSPAGKGAVKSGDTSNGAADEDNNSKKSIKKKKKKLKNPKSSKKSGLIAVTRRDGIYMLIVTVTPVETKKDMDNNFNLELNVAMESKSGYLSATDWPLLPFYGVMSLVYLFYGIVWLIVSACQWRDLLRIQFWIGGVIALGMLEKAVFYSEYNNINNTGITNSSLVVFAEIVSVAKRTLARMLVIIVSMGFGIVKPRLGKSLHRVLGVGALYFIIAIVEGCLRSLSPKADPSKEQLIAGIPLAVLDAAICWWIFMSLVQTTRTLRIRRNVIKLSLYRHFTNTLIFAVLASVAYMIWSIKTHKFAECIKDWSELWLDEAFWHFLFSIILLVIMVLWRPTANNQRYAFTPIVDFDDDEEDNVTLSEAFDGMKMRNTRTEVIVGGDSKKKAEDDLKWVEENIPSSAADTVLPSVLDSDEELMTTKFEMSKME